MNEVINMERLNEEHLFLMDIAERLGIPERMDYGYYALKGVLHAIRDMLQLPEVFYLSARLPLYVRGIYFEGYNPQELPIMMYNDELLKKFRDRMGPRNGDYFEEYIQLNLPEKVNSEEFLKMVSQKIEADEDINPEKAVRAVLQALHKRLSVGEMEDIHSLMNHDVQELLA